MRKKYCTAWKSGDHPRVHNTVTCSGDTVSVHGETAVDVSQTGAFKGQRSDLDLRNGWVRCADVETAASASGKLGWRG